MATSRSRIGQFSRDGGIGVGIPPSGAVTNAMLADMAQSTIKGRAAAAGTGAPTDLTAAEVLAILGMTGFSYEIGTWTPAFTFATPGDLSVSYATQIGSYTKNGNSITARFQLTCTPTFTTASGNASITGLPFTSAEASGGRISQHNQRLVYTVAVPVYSYVALRMNSGSTAAFIQQNGSTQAGAIMAPANFVSGQATLINGSVEYRT